MLYVIVKTVRLRETLASFWINDTFRSSMDRIVIAHRNVNDHINKPEREKWMIKEWG